MKWLLVLFLFCLTTETDTIVFINHAEATSTPAVIEVVYTKEDIIRNIKEVFPDEPRMVKVAKCESGYKLDAKGPTSDHGLFQIYAPTWDKTAKGLGLTEYQTNLEQNLKMARYILDHQAISAWN